MRSRCGCPCMDGSHEHGTPSSEYPSGTHFSATLRKVQKDVQEGRGKREEVEASLLGHPELRYSRYVTESSIRNFGSSYLLGLIDGIHFGTYKVSMSPLPRLSEYAMIRDCTWGTSHSVRKGGRTIDARS